jgi:DNA (cytosine-5)-methyltransferase 1
MTQNGLALELPMPVLHTSDSESLLLPTLKARDHQAEGYEAGLRRSQPQIGTVAKALTSGDTRIANLPTPTVSDQYTGNFTSTQQKPGSMHSVTLAQVFHKPDLFPTPTSRDYKDGSEPHERDGKVQTDTVARAVFNSGEVALMGTPRTSSANGSTPKQVEAGAPKSRIEDQVLTTNWGKFEPAIRRWEAIIGRPAPEPTKPDGKDGNHRLSSKFTEWMMGLPDGWITDIGLKRNDELKACGNGVVPQQAELALSLLGINEILELKLPGKKEP